MKLRAVVLRFHDKESEELLPDFLVRLGRFCQSYDSEADPRKLIHLFLAELSQSEPKVLGVAFLSESEVPVTKRGNTSRIVGHALFRADDWLGSKYGTVFQFELSPGLGGENVAAALRAINPEMQRWAAVHGLTAWQAYPRNRAAARLFTRFGYREVRVVMRRALAIADEEWALYESPGTPRRAPAAGAVRPVRAENTRALDPRGRLGNEEGLHGNRKAGASPPADDPATELLDSITDADAILG